MNCSEFEILLCDYIDGTLDSAERQALEAHQQECAGCAQFAREVTGAVAFMERVPEVEPPPELLTRISFAVPNGKTRRDAKQSWFSQWLQPILQPKFAMGMAMTILSFSMLGRLAGVEVRQLKPADLSPAKIWSAADDKLYRGWQRAVKYYDSLRLVYEVQSRLKEWTDQEEEDRARQAAASAQKQT